MPTDTGTEPGSETGTEPSSEDRKLSALLKKAEPPRSPAHLDEFILKHARHKATQQRELSKSSVSLWFGENWKPAIATFSVAALAVSFSLQIFERSPQEQTLLPESFSLSDTPIQFSDSDELSKQVVFTEEASREREEVGVQIQELAVNSVDENEVQERRNQDQLVQIEALNQAPIDDVSSSALAVNRNSPRRIAQTLSAEPAAQTRVRSAAAGAASLSLSAAPPVQAISADSALGVVVAIEERIATGGAVRSGPFDAASPVLEVSRELISAINAEANVRQQFLSLLSSVFSTNTSESLATSDSDQQSQENSASRVQSLILTYEQLEEPSDYLLLSERYQQLRQDYPDLPAPETLGEAIAVLAELEF